MRVTVKQPACAAEPRQGPEHLRPVQVRKSCGGSPARNSVRWTPSSNSILSTRRDECSG